MRVTRCVRKLEAYTPGEQPKAKNVVKLNTNENPYPPSPCCAKVLAGFDLDKLRRYPDPEFSELRQAIAKLNHTTPERVFIGNGSDEILALSAKAFVENDEAIGSLDPSYSLYKTLAAIRDVAWVGIPEPTVAAAKKNPTGAARVFLSTREGRTATVGAAISAELQMTEPTAFPYAIELTPRSAEVVETITSGSVVPIETTVAPMTNSGT